MATRKNRMRVDGWKRSRLIADAAASALAALSLSHDGNTNLSAAEHFVELLIDDIDDAIHELSTAPAPAPEIQTEG
jgi:dsRNA-specific ribonuclease